MKNYSIIPGKYILLLIVNLLAFNYCSDEESTNPPDNNSPPVNFFPSGDGTNYTYDVEQVDSIGNMQSGLRYTLYDGVSTIESTQYQNQFDSLILETINITGTANFRKTGTGVFYFVDTTGISDIVPDSLFSVISLPSESRLLLFPLEEGSFWPVYSITISNQNINFSPLVINGVFAEKEKITINLINGDIEAEATRVEYTFSIITDLTQPPQRLTANAWFVDDIGIVKLEGRSILINLITGGGLEISDTTSIVTQSLIDFEIK
ncbi:MAG: hypothetical protein O6940_03810 [Ignavibacteria bacterium]|nr:hypothetical protein [Ignavibacteria bacterium]